MILSRLDGADAYEIGWLHRRRPICRPRREVDAEWSDEHGGSSTGAREVRLESIARHGGVDDHCVGKIGGGLDPAAMLFVLAGQCVFGELDRDQIMNEADEARASLMLQTSNNTPFFKMMMRDEKIDRLVACLTRLRPERTLSTR